MKFIKLRSGHEMIAVFGLAPPSGIGSMQQTPTMLDSNINGIHWIVISQAERNANYLRFFVLKLIFVWNCQCGAVIAICNEVMSMQDRVMLWVGGMG
jgi:hypothetical protein